MNQSGQTQVPTSETTGPQSSLAQNARPIFLHAHTFSKSGSRKASRVAPVSDSERLRRGSQLEERRGSTNSPLAPLAAMDRASTRRGSFTGTIPVSSHVPPRLGSVGRMSSTSSMMNNRGSAGRISQEGKTLPTLRKQRSALASRPGPPGPRLRFVIWLSQVYHNYKRPLSFVLDPPILDPRSNEKLAWDSLIMLIVLYSAVMVPFQMGFPEVQLGVAVRAVGVFSDVLFFLDVVQNFLVGYYPDDDENMVRDRRLIAKRYLASWFLPDVFASLPLDYFLVQSDTTPGVGTGSGGGDSISNAQVLSLRLARLTRLLRITKLTRLIKLRHFAAKVEDAFDLDAVLARLTRLIGQVLLVTHIFSCFWHLIGYTTEDEGHTWMEDAQIRNDSVGDQYIYSFYWVVATVCGVGYGDIHATNKTERLFSMAVSIVGASGFGLIIGSLTKILENWHRETTTRARKLSMIQAFIHKKRLPRALKVRLMRYFRHYIAKTSAFDERELLCEFSLSLRGEILHETYKNTFFRIPAFKRLSTQFVLDMAMFIKPLIVVKGDVLAREGCVGTEMFILNTGIIEVRRTPPENPDWIVVLEILTERGVFGEASLLQYAPHSNSYTAKATSDLFTLPKEDFDHLIEEFPDAEHAMIDYHGERSAMYDLVFEQTLARYRMFIVSQNNDPVSGVAGLENLYPTLTVLLDGVLRSYRSLPLPILQSLELQLSMGISVFNSATEKMNMIWLLSQDAKSANAMSNWQLIKWKLLTPINPFHWHKLTWDIFTSILLAYCAIAIPYEASFLGDEGTTLSPGMDIVTEIAFTVDIIINLRTAVVVDLPGEGQTAIIERHTKWREYIRGWFWMDLLSALPVSVIVAASDQSIEHSMSSQSWVLSLVHSLRLLKLARIFKFIHTLQREESSTALGATLATHHNVARVMRLMCRVSFIAHVLACGYFFVARLAREASEGRSIRSYFPDDQNSNGEMYIYFLYWAVTTMTTVGYGDTPPLTVAEVAYVSIGVLIGASTFTYVVGTLSSVVEELNEASDTFRTRIDHLKAYLRERGIYGPLADRLRRYYEYYLLQRDDENEETILSALSDDLRSQLVLHLNRDVVSKIGFFATQDDTCVSCLMGILDPEFCTPGEYVFKEGQVGRHMYFLVKGVAEVVFKADSSEEQVVATLLEGSYFGEIAMLTRSKRAASIRAKTYMSLFVLSLHGLDRISLHYPEMAHSIIQEFRNKITHIKRTSVKQLGSLVQEDVKQARERSGLLAAPGFSGSGNVNSGGNRSETELRGTLGEFETILGRIVEIYGGGDRGKRKALTCVMQHLHKYEFSIDDFLQAAEELNYSPIQPAIPKINGYSASAGAMLNSLQLRMRRRSSFS